MPAIPGSVPLTGVVAPTDSTDTYPVVDGTYGVGGHREVATVADRDAIPAARRRLGMVVHVQDSGATYRLLGTTDNAGWAAAAAGGDLSYTHNQLVPAAVWTIRHNLGKRPSVSVTDSAGTDLIGDVAYLDSNTLTVSFAYPFGGSAFLN